MELLKYVDVVWGTVDRARACAGTLGSEAGVRAGSGLGDGAATLGSDAGVGAGLGAATLGTAVGEGAGCGDVAVAGDVGLGKCSFCWLGSFLLKMSFNFCNVFLGHDARKFVLY